MALGWVPKSVGQGLFGLGGARGRQAMLLLEQGVLWVLPMLWLVLLLSEAGAVLETGCSLEMGPGSRRPPRGNTKGKPDSGPAVVALAWSPGTFQPSCTNPHGSRPSWPLSPWGGDEHGAPGAGGRADGRGAPRQVGETLRSCRQLEQDYSPIALPGLYR